MPIIEIESEWRETGIICPCGWMTYSNGKSRPQCANNDCLKTLPDEFIWEWLVALPEFRPTLRPADPPYSERDALNVAIAKIQELSAWVIAQEKCPDCFGDITDVEISVDNIHRFYYECCDCGSKWLNFGKKNG